MLQLPLGHTLELGLGSKCIKDIRLSLWKIVVEIYASRCFCHMGTLDMSSLSCSGCGQCRGVRVDDFMVGMNILCTYVLVIVLLAHLSKKCSKLAIVIGQCMSCVVRCPPCVVCHAVSTICFKSQLLLYPWAN